MDEEEKKHFPTLEREASQEELDKLFDRYKKAEKKAKPS
jgi:hypothetical protein